MSNVVNFPGKETVPTVPAPCQELIDGIKDALERAEAGELQSFIGIGFTHDGGVYHMICDFHENNYEVLGALQWLVQRHFFEYMTDDD